MAGAIAVVFFLAFWDKMSNYDTDESVESQVAAAEAGVAEEAP